MPILEKLEAQDQENPQRIPTSYSLPHTQYSGPEMDEPPPKFSKKDALFVTFICVMCILAVLAAIIVLSFVFAFVYAPTNSNYYLQWCSGTRYSDNCDKRSCGNGNSEDSKSFNSTTLTRSNFIAVLNRGEYNVTIVRDKEKLLYLVYNTIFDATLGMNTRSVTDEMTTVGQIGLLYEFRNGMPGPSPDRTSVVSQSYFRVCNGYNEL